MTNTLIFEHSFWFIFLFVIIAFGFTFILYFRDKKLDDLNKKKIAIIAGIRFIYILIILILLLSPFIKTITTKVEKPLIIFAVDNSKSIKLEIKDEAELKQISDKLFNTSLLINKKYDVRNFSFDDKITDTLKFDFSGNKTDISNLVTQVNDKFYNKNIGALIIASDGIYNSGANPIYLTNKSNYAIYSIGLGDTTMYQDVFIKEIVNNEIAFLNNKFPVSISVGAKKFKDKNVELNVISNGKTIYSKNLLITSNNFLQTINFNVDADKVGIQEYKVVVKINEKERNKLNNQKNFAVKVIENKQKILILANSPHPDVSALQNSLKSNSNFEIEVDFAYSFAKDITDYSLVFLYNLPSNNYPSKKLFINLKKAKIPLIIVVGMQTNLNLFNAQKLGLEISQTNELYDDVQGYIDPSFKDFDISEEIEKLVKLGPPLKVPFADFSYIPQIKTVLKQEIKGIKTNKPLVLLSSGNSNYQSNIVFLIGENFWRLRIYDYRINENFRMFDEFIQQIVQYAVLKSKRNRFIVKVDKIIPENNEITFKAEVYDKIYQLVNENDVNLELIDSIGNKFNYIFDNNINSYSLNVGSFPAGHYNFIAKTEYDGQKLIEKGSFVVMPVDVEAQVLVANHTLLKKISYSTGGKFFLPKNIDSLQNYLQNDPNIVSVSYSSQDIEEIINKKWLFILIVLLFATEWFLRKFFGTY